MSVRVGIVGCGALANLTHLPNSAASDDLELVACCDVDAQAAERAATTFGGRPETDWRKVVAASDIDLIVLATHTSLRAELIEAAVKAGKPVYTEKPLADTMAETEHIRRVIQSSSVPVCVGHNRRSGPAVAEFRRLTEHARSTGADRDSTISWGERGRPELWEESSMQLLLRINDDSRSWKPWIFNDPYGIMLAEMVHFVDLSLWLTGRTPVSVTAIGSRRGNFTQVIEFDDSSQTTIQHTMVGNFDSPKELFEATLRNVTVVLDNHVEVRQRGLESEPFRTDFPLEAGGELAATTGITGFHEASDALRKLRAAGEDPGVRFVTVNKGHRQHLERFARHIQGDGENPCPVESAVVVTRVALRLLESALEGRSLRIRPEDIDPNG